MDRDLFDLVNDKMPKINPKIANGLATSEMHYVVNYLHSILTALQDNLPEGLEYLGIIKMTPLQEYLKTIEARGGNKSNFDLARNDFFMVEINFKFNGEPINKHLYLPYCRDGGLITIRGATFEVNPVLADKGISISKDTIFIRIPKARMPFRKRLKHHFICNGKRHSPSIPHSWIHNRSRRSDKTAGKVFMKMETTLAHYLFCKYGLKETFKRFLDIDIQVGSEEEINEKNYPKDKWAIFQSMKLKPQTIKAKVYTPNTMRIAMPLCDVDNIVDSMVGAFFYIVDHFPTRIKPEFIDGTDNEIYQWRVLLGTIIGGITGGEGAIKRGMDEHMGSLDSYIDSAAKLILEQGDVFVDDFYQLLFYVIELLTGMVTQPIDEAANIYDKQLVVLSYALQSVVTGFNTLNYKLNSKATKKELTFRDVSKIIRSVPKAEVAMSMSTGHNEINSASSSGDNKFFKITNKIVLQTDSGVSGKGGKTKSSASDISKFLHASISEVGSYLTLPKSEPTGRSRINPFLTIASDGTIIRNEEDRELLDRTQHKFLRD